MFSKTQCAAYSRVPGDGNWHIETADWNLAGFFTIFRNLLAGIWCSFLRFIETGFRKWLAACLGFLYDFSMMSVNFQDFFIIFLWFLFDSMEIIEKFWNVIDWKNYRKITKTIIRENHIFFSWFSLVSRGFVETRWLGWQFLKGL